MTAPRAFRQGDVLAYPFLWRWQAERGETEGRKSRPACLALPLYKSGVTHLFLLPITGTRPRADQMSLEIPEIERRRAGLRIAKVGWIILDECNYDVAERSFFLDRSQPPLGRFSEAFAARIKAGLRAAIEGRTLTRIDRNAD